MSDWWNQQGRALHEDLTDPSKEEWIANITRRERWVIAKWWQLAERYDHEGLRNLIRKLLHLSTSVDGFRSIQIKESIQGLRVAEDGDARLHPGYAKDEPPRGTKDGPRGL